jgi:uncharacterized protein (TIGR02118 family)
VIKRLTMWHARPGMARQEALRYWRDDHAPVVRTVPGVRRYVQDHCVESPEGGEPPYTGLGEVWFGTVEAAQAALGTPEWAAVIEGAATFMDMGRILVAWAEEHVLI